MNLSSAFGGFRLWKLALGKSPETLSRDWWGFKKFVEYFNDGELETITEKDMENFFRFLYMESGLSHSSIQAIWATLRSFYTWAEKDLGAKRPDKAIPLPEADTERSTPFTEDEIKALVKACEYSKPAETTRRKSFRMKRPSANRDVALVLLLLDTGLRVSECGRLLVENVNLETGEVEVKTFRAGRKSKSRFIYIDTRTRQALWKYLQSRENVRKNDPLFVSKEGKPMDKNSIRHLLNELGKRANVPKCHPHRFRHTFALQFLRNGGNVFELQDILGHSDLEMVRRYAHEAQIDIKNACRRASPVGNWRL